MCLLCYNVAPKLLQRRLDLAFEIGTCRVTVPGTKVVPIALCEALDGCDSADYCQEFRLLIWVVAARVLHIERLQRCSHSFRPNSIQVIVDELTDAEREGGLCTRYLVSWT